MIAAPQVNHYSIEEYLALEIESECRHEYWNGVIVPITGGKPAHNKLASAFNALLWFGLRGKPYSIFITDQRLWIPKKQSYTYPDGMVIVDPVALQPGRTDTVMNPVLIAEILSDSTEKRDRGDKFKAYRTIPTFQEYLLIDQYQPCVEQFVRQGDRQWLLTEHKQLTDEIVFSSIPATIILGDLYENLDL